MMVTRPPYRMTRPMSAPTSAHRGERSGRGRHHGVRELHRADEPGRHHAHVQPAGERRGMDQRVEDEIAHVREDREPDDEAAQRERERHTRLADPPDHRDRDPLDAARVLERFGQNRAEDDHDRDALYGPAEPLLERVDERLAVDTGDQREQDDRHEQRNEDVPPEPGDQQKEERHHGHQAGDGDKGALGDHRWSSAEYFVPPSGG